MVRSKALLWDVTIAVSFGEARAALRGTPFDIIVSDYHLPDGTSDQLFDEVVDLPFVLVTSTLEEQLALRTLQRGADDYCLRIRRPSS